MTSKRNLVMLRGLPGSGKSTVAEMLGAPVCTADDYLMEDGKYVFKPEKLGWAHKQCQMKCENFMKAGIEKIVVANTSTTKAELAPYADMAKQYGYNVHYLIVENRRGGQSIHSVPQENIEKMRSRFDVQL